MAEYKRVVLWVPDKDKPSQFAKHVVWKPRKVEPKPPTEQPFSFKAKDKPESW